MVPNSDHIAQKNKMHLTDQKTEIAHYYLTQRIRIHTIWHKESGSTLGVTRDPDHHYLAQRIRQQGAKCLNSAISLLPPFPGEFATFQANKREITFFRGKVFLDSKL